MSPRIVMILRWVRDVPENTPAAIPNVTTNNHHHYRMSSERKVSRGTHTRISDLYGVRSTRARKLTNPFTTLLYPLLNRYSPWHSFDKESVDMTHRVDKFMFGPQTSIFAKHLRAEWEVTKSLEKEGYHMNSMAGQVYESESKEKKTHEHYLRLMQTDIETKIVRKFSKSRPVYNAFSGMIFKTFQTFQYAVNTHTIKEDEQELPSVRFVWDMDPIGVEIKLERKSMYEFITSLLAIIGGVFTLFGIVDSSVYSITKRLCKRRGSSASSSKNGSSSNHHAEGGNGTSKMYPTSVTGGLVY